MLAPRSPLPASSLRRYFYSGWAFLMPYLFAYLLYYATGWPVNASRLIENGESRMQNNWVPCLLHVYWALHAIHVILAGFALWSWWSSYRSKYQGPSIKCQDSEPNPSGSGLPATNYQLPTTSASLSLLTALAPWVLLALLFYIPGVYLEWPSDPWEHLRRINEWRILDTVGAHSSWMKSAYFIPYSMLSWCIGLRQLFWLDFYYTGICLLLCWQYYRFSRACGLGKRASMVFVIIQALLFGNNIFSFYRYYGISSSIYAQLGAIALTRIVLEFAARGTKLDAPSKYVGPQLACVPSADPSTDARSAPTQAPSPIAHHPSPIAPNPSPITAPALAHGSDSLHRIIYSLLATRYSLLLSIPCLLPLIAFNHVQGLGIAGLGVTAVIVWRLIEWKRSALWWLIGATIIINALFLWLYSRPPIIETYRSQGWLNVWYGFDILDLTSPAGDRMLQIVSIFGLINLAAALILLRRNSPVVWITILPLIALLLPFLSIPIANALSTHGDAINIITFHRMLFAIPLGLASISLGARLMSGPVADLVVDGRWPYRIFFVAITCLVLTALMALPSSTHSYNRAWSTSSVIPDDLRLQDVFLKYEADQVRLLKSPERTVVTNQAGTALLSCYFAVIGASTSRTIALSPIDSICTSLNFFGIDAKTIESIPTRYTETTQEPNATGGVNLIADPKAHDPAAWFPLGGYAPDFASGILDQATASTAMQNPEGKESNPFTSTMIPIQRQKNYRLEMSVKQVRNTEATVFLAVAWYDAEGKLLASNDASPSGAGNPRGWNNGTYSYFGLTAQKPPTFWTTFGISFGLYEAASIPQQACFVRVGALLNYNATPSAIIQLTDVRLFEKAPPEIGLAMPGTTSVHSPASQAALLSAHWPPEQVLVDHGGTKEILAAADAAYVYLRKPNIR